MQTIWEFPLKVTDEQTVSMPKGATVLSVGNQNEQVCIWAMAKYPTTEYEQRQFVIIGKGNPFHGDYLTLAFIGMAMQCGGAMVWHVFERIENYPDEPMSS